MTYSDLIKKEPNLGVSAKPPELLPLCVDLDETFCKVDTLWEVAMRALRYNPFRLAGALARFPFHRNRSRFKAELSAMVKFYATYLPVRPEVLDYVQAARAAGRRTLLVTGADQAIAEAVAAGYPYFDEVHGSGNGVNLKSRNKAAWLVERFEKGGYEYVGDCAADAPVWESAGVARVVAFGGKIPAPLRNRVPKLLALAVPPRRGSWRILRPHQWAKNLLVFVPLAMAHRLNDLESLGMAALAFGALCFAASAIYIFNDFLDVPEDRRHPEKCRRLIASGDIHFSTALLWGAGCVLGAVGLAWSLPAGFWGFLLAYWGMAAAYALGLKRIFGLDVLLLISFYLLRLLLGAAAVAVPCSEWLLILAAAFFGSLAILKRYAELQLWVRIGQPRILGRAYSASESSGLLIAGIVGALASAAVFPFYVQSQTAREIYQVPELLLAWMPLVLVWFYRMWRAALAGRMPGDPLVFALKDPVSYLVGVAGLAIAWIATVGI